MLYIAEMNKPSSSIAPERLNKEITEQPINLSGAVKDGMNDFQSSVSNIQKQRKVVSPEGLGQSGHSYDRSSFPKNNNSAIYTPEFDNIEEREEYMDTTPHEEVSQIVFESGDMGEDCEGGICKLPSKTDVVKRKKKKGKKVRFVDVPQDDIDVTKPKMRTSNNNIIEQAKMMEQQSKMMNNNYYDYSD